MPYGIIKIDTITFTDAGVDKSVSISGLVQNPTFTGNVTATGTISGLIVQAPTVTGTTANFASGVYTTQISGAIVKVPAGSAGAPSIQVGVGASVAPGLYGAGTDLLGISTGGAGRIFIDSTGRLGVGTSSPQNALVVSNGGAEGLEIVPTGGTPNVIAFNRSTAAYAPLTLNGSVHILQTSGTERLRIDSSGRVGIGTSAPEQILTIVNNSTSVATGSTLSVVGGTTNIAGEGGSIAFSNFVKSGVTSAARIRSGLVNAITQETGYLVFDTNGGSGLTERLRIDNNGNVGIGTSSPGYKLTVRSDSSATNAATPYDNTGFVIRNDDTTAGNYSSLSFNTLSSISADISVATIAGISTSKTNGASTGELVFYTTNSTVNERARIDSSGRLLVGTSSARSFFGGADTPGLQIEGITDVGREASITSSLNGDRGGVLLLAKQRSGAVGGQTIVQSGDQLGYLGFQGSDGTKMLAGAAIEGIVDGTPGTDDMPGRLVFSTTADGASSPTERLRIDSTGRVGIGITAPTAALDIAGQTVLSNAGDGFGIKIINSSVKTYPAAGGQCVGFLQAYNVANATSITTPTVTFFANRVNLTKSGGNVQDIDGFNVVVYGSLNTWGDLNTCRQYTYSSDLFIYSGIDANSRTSNSFSGPNIALTPPDLGTQTISTVNAETIQFAGATGGTCTVNVTNWISGPFKNLRFFANGSGTRTYNLTNASFYDMNAGWGVAAGTTGMVATITNLFGLRLRPPASTTGLTITNNWGLYQEWSSAKNWFAGESNQFPNITTTASGANAFLDSADSNRLYRSTSSLVYKRDIEDLDSNFADQILNLRPVWYRSKCDADCQDWSWYGLIAEEVAEIDPRFVHYGYQEDAYELVDVKQVVDLPEGDPRREEGIETEEVTRQERQLKADAQQVPNGVAYERLVVPLLDIIKRQKSQLDSFETRLAALEAR